MSPSARRVAHDLLILAGDPRYGRHVAASTREWTERLLLATGLARLWSCRLYRQPWFAVVARLYESLTVPGLRLHFGLRKRFIEERTRRALADGVRQVVNLGAGLDTLCPRLALDHPSVQFFEFDRERNHLLKRRGLERLGAFSPNLFLGTADLESPLDLLPTLWSTGSPGVVILEGVLMYLSPPAAVALLENIRNWLGPGSTLLLTSIRTDRRGRVLQGRASRWVTLAMKSRGEPFRWALPRKELEGLLSRLGYRRCLALDEGELRQRYLGEDRAGGPIEWVVELGV